MDLISIIVPIYNVEKYLEKCLVSIINQTYQNLEIILIDDGSTDLSGLICEQYKEKDRRIKVIHKENGGLPSARNAGLEQAKGEWIVFIDSDDYVASELVQYCYNLSVQKKVDLVVYEWKIVDENGYIKEENSNEESIQQIGGNRLLEQFIKNGMGHAIVCNKFYKREIWDNLMFPIGRLHEDEYVICDILKKVKYAIISSKKLYYYRKRKGSITNTFNKKSFYDKLDAFQYRCEKLKSDQELYDLTLECYLGQLVQIYKIEDRATKRTIIKLFRKKFNLFTKYMYWKTKILYSIFYISPQIYLSFIKIFSL